MVRTIVMTMVVTIAVAMPLLNVAQIKMPGMRLEASVLDRLAGRLAGPCSFVARPDLASPWPTLAHGAVINRLA